MTVSTETRKAGPFTGNGTVSAFPFNFKVFAASDVAVYFTADNGAESVMQMGTDYSVQLNADQESSPGGTVHTNVPLATGRLLTITSHLPYLQHVRLTNQGGFYPDVINTALDRLTIFSQQLAEQVGRAVKVNISSGVKPDKMLNDLIADADSARNAASSAESNAGVASAAATAAQQANQSAQTALSGAVAARDAAAGSAASANASAQTADNQAAQASAQAQSASTSASQAATSNQQAQSAATTATQQAQSASTSAQKADASAQAAAASAQTAVQHGGVTRAQADALYAKLSGSSVSRTTVLQGVDINTITEPGMYAYAAGIQANANAPSGVHWGVMQVLRPSNSYITQVIYVLGTGGDVWVRSWDLGVSSPDASWWRKLAMHEQMMNLLSGKLNNVSPTSLARDGGLSGGSLILNSANGQSSNYAVIDSHDSHFRVFTHQKASGSVQGGVFIDMNRVNNSRVWRQPVLADTAVDIQGYAPSYTARVWGSVLFHTAHNAQLLGAGNVSSVSARVNEITVNFIIPLPDASYSVVCSVFGSTSGIAPTITSQTANGFTLAGLSAGRQINFAVFR